MANGDIWMRVPEIRPSSLRDAFRNQWFQNEDCVPDLRGDGVELSAHQFCIVVGQIVLDEVEGVLNLEGEVGGDDSREHFFVVDGIRGFDRP